MDIGNIPGSSFSVESVFGHQIRILHVQKTTNKSVTYVVGFHPDPKQAKAFLSDVSSCVGASGFHKRIEEVDQRAPVFGFFGDHRDAIRDILSRKYDISDRNITV